MSINNIILDFGMKESEINDLKSRLDNKKQTYTIVKVSKEAMNGNPTKAEIEQFSKVDSNTRIYLFAHGGLSREHMIVGHDFPELVGTRKEVEFRHEDVSEYLLKRLNLDVVKNSDKHIKISIIACHSGLKTPEKEYFAFHLHRDLAKNGLLTDINARTSKTSILSSSGEHTGKKVVRSLTESNLDSISDVVQENVNEWVSTGTKKPGTKVRLTWNQEESQVIKDAYLNKFYKVSKSACEEMKQQLNHKKFDDFNDRSKLLSEIDRILTSISNNESSDLNTIRKLYQSLENIQTSINSHSSFSSPSLKQAFGISTKFINTLYQEEKVSQFKSEALEIHEYIFDNLSKELQPKKSEIKDRLKAIVDQCSSGDQSEELNIMEVVKQIRSVKADYFKNDALLSKKFIELCTVGKTCMAKRGFIETEVTKFKMETKPFSSTEFLNDTKDLCNEMLDTMSDHSISNLETRNELKEIIKYCYNTKSIDQSSAKDISARLKKISTPFSKFKAINDSINKLIRSAQSKEVEKMEVESKNINMEVEDEDVNMEVESQSVSNDNFLVSKFTEETIDICYTILDTQKIEKTSEAGKAIRGILNYSEGSVPIDKTKAKEMVDKLKSYGALFEKFDKSISRRIEALAQLVQ